MFKYNGGGVDAVINWEQVREEWETTDITFKALAEKYGSKDSTVRSRKNREKWQRNETSNATQNNKSVATKKAKSNKIKKVEKEPVIENNQLTDKQRLFCIYYLKSFNATKAYQKAYGCSYESAMVSGHHHLRNPKINAEIDRIKEERATELKIDIRDIIQKYIDIAFADITDFVEFGHRPRTEVVDFDKDDKPIYGESEGNYNYFSLNESSEIDGTILSEVKEGKEGITVKLADKMKALEFLTKYMDVLPETQKRRLEEEKLKLELTQMSGETDGDAHEQGSSYEQALNAHVEDVFADEEVDADGET